MFEAVLDNSILLRKVAETSKGLINNITFRVNKEGMRFTAMDSAKSVLVDFSLTSSFFKEFKCSEEHMFKLPIDAFLNVLRTSSGDETCLIMMSSPSSDVVHITFENSAGKVRKTTTRLDEEDEEPVVPPKAEYSAIVRLDALEFRKEISNFHDLFEVINIKTSTDGVIFSGKYEKQQFETTFKSANHDLNSSIRLEIRQNTNSDFNRKTLETVIRAASISETVELRIGKLLCVKYPIGDDGYLKYMLAARIQDEEDEMED